MKKRIILSNNTTEAESLINKYGLHTVCSSARCPNKSECFSQKKATFMILGDTCTRSCAFCSVKKGWPLEPDGSEPERLAKALKTLGLRHAVITSVTRDDLEDGGAGHFRDCALKIKSLVDKIVLEALVPDFMGRPGPIETVSGSSIDIFGHNIETVPRLYSKVRPRADYKRSLGVLELAKKKCASIKSGLMVGLGETEDEIICVMRDLLNAGCESLTIGQYLRPTRSQLEVESFIHPDVFAGYKDKAISMGFKHVLAEPFARTSYMKH